MKASRLFCTSSIRCTDCAGACRSCSRPCAPGRQTGVMSLISFSRARPCLRHPEAFFRPSLCVPDGDGDACGYRGGDQRLRPLGRKVRGVREDITDECRNRADRGLPAHAVSRPVHLYEKSNGHGRADNPANRSETRVLETESGENVAARHHEKTREPGTCKLFNGRAGKAARAQSEQVGDGKRKARHRLTLSSSFSTTA